MRPVIGLVACHSKCSQPIRGGAQEAGENCLFCLQLQREADQRTVILCGVWTRQKPREDTLDKLINYLIEEIKKEVINRKTVP